MLGVYFVLPVCCCSAPLATTSSGSQGPLERISIIGILIALVTIGGCGPKHNSRAAAVDPKLAESTLVTTLDAWKSGKKPEDLAGLQPKIVVQDMDWKLGSRLSDYKVTGNSTPRDANLIAEVQLTLVNDKGKESKKTVKYIVGTDPVLTVFRQMMD